MFFVSLLVIIIEAALNLCEDTELFTQKIRMMKVMRRRWDEGDDKMIWWNIMIPGKETVITAAAICVTMNVIKTAMYKFMNHCSVAIFNFFSIMN